MTESSLAPTSMGDQFHLVEEALEQAYSLAVEHLRGVDSRPVSRLASWDQMQAALDEPLPETGTAPGAAIAEWAERAAAGIVGSAGPRFSVSSSADRPRRRSVAIGSHRRSIR